MQHCCTVNFSKIALNSTVGTALEGTHLLSLDSIVGTALERMFLLSLDSIVVTALERMFLLSMYCGSKSRLGVLL